MLGHSHVAEKHQPFQERPRVRTTEDNRDVRTRNKMPTVIMIRRLNDGSHQDMELHMYVYSMVCPCIMPPP